MKVSAKRIYAAVIMLGILEYGYRATEKAQKSAIGTIFRLTEGVLKGQVRRKVAPVPSRGECLWDDDGRSGISLVIFTSGEPDDLYRCFSVCTHYIPQQRRFYFDYSCDSCFVE